MQDPSLEKGAGQKLFGGFFPPREYPPPLSANLLSKKSGGNGESPSPLQKVCQFGPGKHLPDLWGTPSHFSEKISQTVFTSPVIISVKCRCSTHLIRDPILQLF